MSINVNGAPVVSIPIAICLFFMMYPIMVKIDFASVIKTGKNGKPVFLTLFINWCIKPFSMYAISLFFLGVLFKGFIGVDAVDPGIGKLCILKEVFYNTGHFNLSKLIQKHLMNCFLSLYWIFCNLMVNSIF